jgi:hypothetical protein
MSHYFWYLGIVLFIFCVISFLEFRHYREDHKKKGESIKHTILYAGEKAIGEILTGLAMLSFIIMISLSIILYFMVMIKRMLKLRCIIYLNRRAAWHRILKAVWDMGGHDENIHQLLRDENSVKKVAEAIFAEELTYELTIDDSVPFDLLIKDANISSMNSGYEEVDSWRQDKGKGKQKVTARIVKFPGSSTYMQRRASLDSRGLKPAEPIHLFTLLRDYPFLPDVWPIIAYGQKVGKSQLCPYAYMCDLRRCLGFTDSDEKKIWCDPFILRMLAVPKDC